MSGKREKWNRRAQLLWDELLAARTDYLAQHRFGSHPEGFAAAAKQATAEVKALPLEALNAIALAGRTNETAKRAHTALMRTVAGW